MSATPTIVLENGTMLGAMSEPRKVQVIPEIVISSSISSLHRTRSRSRNDIHEQELPVESTALLEQQQQHPQVLPTGAEEDNEFEQFILNRTTSESNMLESSIYSELQFSSAANVAASAASPASAAALNASACSRTDSRQGKRTRRKGHKGSNKAKCSSSSLGGGVGGVVPGVGAATAAAAAAASAVAPPVGSYPPQYTAIFLDPHHHQQANALASAAASSPFLQSNPESAASFLQYHQYYQQRPMGMAQHPHLHPHPHHHHLRR